MLPGSADIGILVGTEVNLRSLQPNSGSIDTVLGSDLSPLVHQATARQAVLFWLYFVSLRV